MKTVNRSCECPTVQLFFIFVFSFAYFNAYMYLCEKIFAILCLYFMHIDFGYNNNNICLFQTHKIGTAYICRSIHIVIKNSNTRQSI